MSGHKEQWVNLPRDKKFVEDEIKSVERVGPFHVEVKFKKATLSNFKVRVRKVGDQAKYTKSEERRNPNFRIRKILTSTNEDKDKVKLAADIFLAAAGGDTYKIDAKHKKKTVEAKVTLKTRRKLFYQIIKMKGITGGGNEMFSHMENEYWNPKKNFYIKLKKISSKGEIESIPNLDYGPQQDKLPKITRSKYNEEKDLYCFAILLVDQLAASELQTFKKSVTIGTSDIIMNLPQYLWVDLDKDGTPEAKWLIKGEFIETKTGTKKKISPKDISPVGRKAVKIKTKDLPSGKNGIIKLKLKVVNRWRTGLSFPKNLICIATRSKWTQRDDSVMKSTLVHESGHKLGMVPDGTNLDSQSSHYYLRGDHCNNESNRCVMYGRIHSNRKDIFCSICAKSVRKLDLFASKLPGFKRF